MTLQNPPDKRAFWRQLENGEKGARLPLARVLDMLRTGEDGLLPVVAQCADSGRVLMLAWMNRDALAATLAEGALVYYSRQRKTLWRKGATSGCIQQLQSLAIDCDGDALLATVKQTGAACHTGRRSCFYIEIDGEDAVVRDA